MLIEEKRHLLNKPIFSTPLDIASTTSDASSNEGHVSNDESATEAESASVTQRRNLLDSKLNNYKREKLKRRLPKDGQLLE